MDFFGRLHPLVVHLPIGFLLLAALFEFISRFKGNQGFKASAKVALLVGALAAVVACATGLQISNDSYDKELLSQHKFLGITTAFLSLLLLWISNSKKIFQAKLSPAFRLVLFLPLVLLIFATGHWGGSLTHGEDFLFADFKVAQMASKEKKLFDKYAPVYVQLIQPLLEEKCYRCHSSKKQKGKLRLDNPEFILKGGKGGAIIDLANLPQSEILTRIHLPIEDEDHMPPSDNDQLSSGEIDLLTNWVESGASFTDRVSDLPDSTKYLSYFEVGTTENESSWWPVEEVREPESKAIESLTRSGVAVDFLSGESNYIHLSFVGYDSFPNQAWKDVMKLNENIISLRLSDVTITSADLDNISKLKNIRRLFLDKVLSENQALEKLKSLVELRYLNLSGNPIGDKDLDVAKNLNYSAQLYFTKPVARMMGFRR
jgi:uncharacterized membrane protein